MLARTAAGLSLSIRIGVVTACVSGALALVLGAAAALLGRWADGFVTWLIDLFMGCRTFCCWCLFPLCAEAGVLGGVRGDRVHPLDEPGPAFCAPRCCS